jgi:hypothetical protein
MEKSPGSRRLTSQNGDINPFGIRSRMKTAVLRAGAAGIELIGMSGADDK